MEYSFPLRPSPPINSIHSKHSMSVHIQMTHHKNITSTLPCSNFPNRTILFPIQTVTVSIHHAYFIFKCSYTNLACQIYPLLTQSILIMLPLKTRVMGPIALFDMTIKAGPFVFCLEMTVISNGPEMISLQKHLFPHYFC